MDAVEQELRGWCDRTHGSSSVPPLDEHKAMLLRAADRIAELTEECVDLEHSLMELGKRVE